MSTKLQSGQFDLYPVVDRPEGQQLTWEGMLYLAQSDPIARHFVMLAERGDCTREQTLIALAFAWYDARRQHHHAEVKRLDETIPNVIIADGKRYDRRHD